MAKSSEMPIGRVRVRAAIRRAAAALLRVKSGNGANARGRPIAQAHQRARRFARRARARGKWVRIGVEVGARRWRAERRAGAQVPSAHARKRRRAAYQEAAAAARIWRRKKSIVEML